MRHDQALLAAGCFMLFFALIYPMVTLVVDDTPPTIIFIWPQDGEVYDKLSSIQVNVTDSPAGVNYVEACIYNEHYVIYWQGNLSLKDGDQYDGFWAVLLLPALADPGDYYCEVHAVDNVGHERSQTVSFTIYTELQGKWYINNQEVVDQTQTFLVGNPTVSFKFVKTQGVDDSYISCWIEEGGSTILTLTNTDPGTWEGSYTFSPGTHTLTLTASDGDTTITFSIIDLTIPGAQGQLPVSQREYKPSVGFRGLLFMGGLILISLGLIQRMRRGS